MFMHPDDFHAQVEPNDFGVEDMYGYARKLDAAQREGQNEGVGDNSLYDEVSANGINRPVSVWHPTDTEVRSGWKSGPYLRNGHHRVAVATDLTSKGQTTYIPVQHTDAATYYETGKF